MDMSNLFISPQKSKSAFARIALEMVRHSLIVIRYILKTQIPKHICDKEATVDLAKCCIYYLCQNHHDPFLLDDELKENLMSGEYQFKSYAETAWLELIRRYIHLNGGENFSTDLLSAIERLMMERSRHDFKRRTKLKGHASYPHLDKIKARWPKLYATLRNEAEFWEQCPDSEYHLNRG